MQYDANSTRWTHLRFLSVENARFIGDLAVAQNFEGNDWPSVAQKCHQRRERIERQRANQLREKIKIGTGNNTNLKCESGIWFRWGMDAQPMGTKRAELLHTLFHLWEQFQKNESNLEYQPEFFETQRMRCPIFAFARGVTLSTRWIRTRAQSVPKDRHKPTTKLVSGIWACNRLLNKQID